MRFRHDGEGLHRSVDPADGRSYVYGMSFMDAAPSIFACFDQPDLKAPYTLHVTAPADWTVIGNAPGRAGRAPGRQWEFEQTQPLSTYFVTLVAGPYHLIRDEHDGIPLGLERAADHRRATWRRDADELFTMTRQCFDEFHRLFGIRYPFGDYHQAFVPEFNAGAMENPGCVTFRDPLVFTSKVTRGAADPARHHGRPRDGAPVVRQHHHPEVVGRPLAQRVVRRVHGQPGHRRRHRVPRRLDPQRLRPPPVGAGRRPGPEHPPGRRQRRGRRDRGPPGLRRHLLRQGLEHPQAAQRHASATTCSSPASSTTSRSRSTATPRCTTCSRAGSGPAAGDLSDVHRQLAAHRRGRTRSTLDRAAGVLRRTPPADAARRAHPHAARGHRGRGRRLASAPLTVDAAEVPFDAGDDAVLLDPDQETWALVLPDEASIAGYRRLFPTTTDELVRACDVERRPLGLPQRPRRRRPSCSAWPRRRCRSRTSDDAVGYTMPWLVKKVVPLSADPVAGLRRLHVAATELLGRRPVGSTIRLAAFQSVISSAVDAQPLEGWLAGDDLPDGVDLDLDLRWRILVQLAAMGAVDAASLQRHLEDEPTGRSRVEHSRAMASLPDAEAKAWAWQRFTGEVPVPNYELEAAGLGMWRPGQEELTAPYVERYFAELPGRRHVHSRLGAR